MPRRRARPQGAYFPDAELVHDSGIPFHEWLKRQCVGRETVTPEDIAIMGLRDRRCPIYAKLHQNNDALIEKARRKIVMDALRTITFRARGIEGSPKFRCWLSVKHHGQRVILPGPWVVRQPEQIAEVIRRSQAFQQSWGRHEQNMLLLQALPRDTRYFKAV
jgi:hypothetical protein